MTTINRTVADDVLVERDIVTHSAARKGLAVLRIAYGFTFLWAFFDKLLALGFHTGYDQDGNLDRFGPAAWVNGGSPTEGFLSFGVPEDNPFKSVFTAMAGDTWVDWLFMIGLLGIGFALFTGIGMRIAAATGARLYMLMYAASLLVQLHPGKFGAANVQALGAAQHCFDAFIAASLQDV